MSSITADLDKQITEHLNVLNVRQKKALLAVAKTFAIEAVGPKYNDTFIAELNSRTSALENGSVKGRTWEEVKQNSKNRFKAGRK